MCCACICVHAPPPCFTYTQPRTKLKERDVRNRKYLETGAVDVAPFQCLLSHHFSIYVSFAQGVVNAGVPCPHRALNLSVLKGVKTPVLFGFFPPPAPIVHLYLEFTEALSPQLTPASDLTETAMRFQGHNFDYASSIRSVHSSETH